MRAHLLNGTTAALDELGRVYLRNAVYFHHPRCRPHAVQPDRALREAPEALRDGRAPVLMHGPSRAPASSSTKPTTSRYSAGHGTTGER